MTRQDLLKKYLAVTSDLHSKKCSNNSTANSSTPTSTSTSTPISTATSSTFSKAANPLFHHLNRPDKDKDGDKDSTKSYSSPDPSPVPSPPSPASSHSEYGTNSVSDTSIPKYHSNLLGSKRRERERDRERSGSGSVAGDTGRSDRRSDRERDRDRIGGDRTAKENTSGSPVYPIRASTATEYLIHTKVSAGGGSSLSPGIRDLSSSGSGRSWSTHTDAFCKVHPETSHTYVRTTYEQEQDVDKEVKKKVKSSILNHNHNTHHDMAGGSDRADDKNGLNIEYKSKAKNILQETDGGKCKDKDIAKKDDFSCSKNLFSSYDDKPTQSIRRQEWKEGKSDKTTVNELKSSSRIIQGYPSFPVNYKGTSSTPGIHILLEQKRKEWQDNNDNNQNKSHDSFTKQRMREIYSLQKDDSKENSALHPAPTLNSVSNAGLETVWLKTVYGKTVPKQDDPEKQKEDKTVLIDDEFASNWHKSSKEKEKAADAHRLLRANQLITELPSMSLSALLQLMLVRYLCCAVLLRAMLYCAVMCCDVLRCDMM